MAVRIAEARPVWPRRVLRTQLDRRRLRLEPGIRRERHTMTSPCEHAGQQALRFETAAANREQRMSRLLLQKLSSIDYIIGDPGVHVT
jgi:hypothetical protein